MKITDIKQQAKRQDRYSVFVDGKYSFPLSEEELLAQDLKIGQEFNKAELEAIKDEAVIDKGAYRVLDLISRRPRSRWEIEDYLKRKNYKPEEVEKIIKKINKKGYIDDLSFAKRWIENRRLLKSTSKLKLRMELRQKRVEEEFIQRALENDEADDQEVIKDLIAKKRSQTRYQDEKKLIAYLARQGFNYSDIKDALKDTEQQ
ncbi:MAG TPA: RecX family transcriptional regulator [Candidatus Saccharimonadales bacterium]|nr:RecX family transcriptional regulator [Candidatus Saccharimonadales bacterium]